MTTYVDSSVVLRLALGQSAALVEWPTVARGITSTLTRVECLRGLENYRRRVSMSDADWAGCRNSTLRILETLEVMNPDPIVLERAAAPMPTPLRTLDAIHLATALLWTESTGETLVLATHDLALGTAARAFGMDVIGLG